MKGFEKKFMGTLFKDLTEEQKRSIEQKEKQLQENMRQYELTNKTQLLERERHIYTAAYWMGRLDAKMEQALADSKK
jgi:hypothetical protein